MLKQTPLHQQHEQAGAKLVDFAGWHMPIHYGSQIQEHHQVRQDVGLFDVSHMGVLDVEGVQACEFLRHALANDVAKLSAPNRALYTCMLNENGGVIDDLIVYYLNENFYRIVLNASRREIDINWLQTLAENFEVNLKSRDELCILAVQGPNALNKITTVLGDAWQELINLKPFHLMYKNNMQVARTGYTGEDGVEIILPNQDAISLWQKLLEEGVKPCGLGARDTLRLEAGLNLYGADMDENITPLEANLAWTVSFKDEARNFVGRDALLKQKQQGVAHQLVGLVMETKGVLRNHQSVSIVDNGEGEITSGSFSPTLGHAIGFARIPNNDHKKAFVERRGQQIPVRIVRPPFVRNGKKVFE
ncbi:MAG: glycine cleavage system aminomethyltransferase GcvT [Gammaproteobacteria bacterium]|nr:glycine cleavage system aminomethyltransferase GcvT [Gammaproteobacteria bacterium]MCH9743459.1 glycine cleavage system aminomethyltransferase GcvT [Gammaproteobacteria bacterium]